MYFVIIALIAALLSGILAVLFGIHNRQCEIRTAAERIAIALDKIANKK